MSYQILLYLLIFSNVNSKKSKELHIGALFPMSGDWAGGIGCRPAALMALNDVNNQSKILPEYHLTMTMEDSQCITGLGAKKMYELLYKPPIKIIFLTGCSTVTTFVAQAAPRWNVIVVAYGASSPALSNRARFPSFFRTHPSASLQNPTRMKLIKRWGWKKISIIWELEEVFTSTVQDLENMATEQNVTIVKRQSFQKHPQSVFLAIKSLLSENARIIVGLFYEKFARKVFCEAYHQGLYGKKIVWIIIGWYADDWWKSNLEQENINCTMDEMKEAVEGHITTESLMWNNDDKETISGLTSLKFKLRLVEMLRNELLVKESRTITADYLHELTKIPGYPEAPLAYDAIWAIALALDKAEKRLKKMYLSLSDFKYHDLVNVVYEQLHKAMNETNFMGVSTLVYFDSSGSRISWTKIEQMIDGSYYLLGYYHFETDNLTLVTEPKWPNRNIPKDSIEIVYKRQVLSLAVYISTCLIILCAISASICVLFIEKNNAHKTIYDCLKIVCCVGCIVSLCGVILLGMDRTRITEVSSNYMFTGYCQMKVVIICLGFNLGYGSLFLSIWFIYRTATKGKKLTTMQTLRHLRDGKKENVQHKTNKNTQSFILRKTNNQSWEIRSALVMFCILDIIVLFVWQYFDPLLRTIFEFPKEKDKLDEDIHYYPYIEMCECKNPSLWLGIIFGWKGLLLILGILLAYETRNTRMSKNEDIRTTCMAIYNVVILALITGPVSIMIKNQQTAHFAFVSVSIVICCCLSIGLIFVPKILRHRKGILNQDNIFIPDFDTIEISQGEDTNRQRLKTENEELKIKISKIEDEIERLQKQLTMDNHENSTAVQVNDNVGMDGINIIEYDQQAYIRKNMTVSKENKKVDKKGLFPKHNIPLELNLCNERHVDEEISPCLENTSGIYSDVIGNISVTKY